MSTSTPPTSPPGVPLWRSLPAPAKVILGVGCLGLLLVLVLLVGVGLFFDSEAGRRWKREQAVRDSTRAIEEARYDSLEGLGEARSDSIEEANAIARDEAEQAEEENEATERAAREAEEARQEEEEEADSSNRRAGAFTLCERLVRARLVAPATADFPWPSSSNISRRRPIFNCLSRRFTEPFRRECAV